MNRPQPAMRWLAQTHYKIGPGARLFVQEAMHIAGEPRPPYSVGDEFNIAPPNVSHLAGHIVSAAPAKLTIDLQGHGQLDLVPTPAGAGQTGFNSSIPAEDWTIV